MPLVTLGDPAYPLLCWIMKAFQDNGSLTAEQKKFNYRLSHACVLVEHVYGRLEGRWQCLLKRLDVNTENVPNVVVTCCLLHNICEKQGDSFDNPWMEGASNDNVNTCVNTTCTGIVQRNAFKAYFSQ